jgi:mRNA interferase HigB
MFKGWLSHDRVMTETRLNGRCGLRVLSKPALVKFWESRKGDSREAKRDLTVWHTEAKNANWKDFGSLKQTFGSADQVGNCVVFDVGNNRYRLIGRINYRYGMLYVLTVMDHKEYDKGLWIELCGCNTPPPKPKKNDGRPRGEMTTGEPWQPRPRF